MLSHLKPLVDNKRLLDSFNNYIDLLIERQHSAIEQADNNIMMYRAQGAIATLRKLKLMRWEVLGDKK